jgi:hypothetical protein
MDFSTTTIDEDYEGENNSYDEKRESVISSSIAPKSSAKKQNNVIAFRNMHKKKQAKMYCHIKKSAQL